MRQLLTGVVAMLLTGAAAAQIYECVDAKGKKEYTQSCPVGTVKETRMTKSGVSAPSSGPASGTGAAIPGAAIPGAPIPGAPIPGTIPPAQKTFPERDAEFRKRAIEREEAEAKSVKQLAEAKDSQRNCDSARSQLKSLQEGQRLVRTNPTTGERYFIEDKDRPSEIANAQKTMQSWCNKK